MKFSHSQAALGEILLKNGFFLTFVRCCYVPKLIPRKPRFDRIGKMSCDWLKSTKITKLTKTPKRENCFRKGKKQNIQK